MKKKSSIIKLSIIGVVLILGIVLSFVSLNFGNTTFKSFTSVINFGQDLKSGTYAVFEADDSETEEDLAVRMSDTRTKLKDLLNSKGYTEASVIVEGSDRIRVELPVYNSSKSFLEVISTPAEMKFTDGTGEVILTHKDIDTIVYGGYDGTTAYVSVTLTRAATRTYNNASGTVSVAATVSGQAETALTVSNSSTSGGKLTILASMTSAENAYYLPDRVMAGQFDVKLQKVEIYDLEPVFGSNTLLLASIAILSGLVLTCAFLAWRYKMFGVIGAGCLLIFSAVFIFLLSVIPGTVVSVASGAGILLSLVLFSDVVIAFCEKVKYEYKNGKSILASFYAGFKKSFRSNLDAHAVIGIAAGVLFLFGGGVVKSFAATMFIGTALSFACFFLVVRGLSRYVLAINSVSENLYGLKRGAEFAGLGSDETDSHVLAQMESETKNANEGGAANEAI